MDQRTILKEVVVWARGEDNVRAVVLTGSVARGEDAFDDLSDLDLELYVSDPSALLDHSAWYEQFGNVLVVEALENPGWHPTRLVYYAEGKIDFMVAPTSVRGVSYDRPFELLLDKDNLRAAFCRRWGRASLQPTPTEFFECVHEFYAAAIMWAKYLARDDPWPAKIRDWDSKKRLLQMLEWDHKVRKGWDFETWHLGARLREWADPELLDKIEVCWSGFSRRRDSVPGAVPRPFRRSKNPSEFIGQSLRISEGSTKRNLLCGKQVSLARTAFRSDGSSQQLGHALRSAVVELRGPSPLFGVP